jgi:hypothetical protein
MICACAGEKVFSQTDSATIWNPTHPSFVLDLEYVSEYKFTFKGQTITLTGEDVWKELKK